MPRTAVDYSKTIIYKIVCKDLSVKDLYVGHTTDFIRRKYTHMYICCNPEQKKHSLKVYQIIRDNGGWENWEMVEVEKYPCSDSNEARSRERFWYENLYATLNSSFPLRNKYEYRKTNKDLLHEKARKFYEINKERIKLNVYLYANDNKDKISQRSKLYREKNADVIKAHKGAVEICECGIQYTHAHRQRHLRTKIHQKNMKNLLPEQLI